MIASQAASARKTTGCVAIRGRAACAALALAIGWAAPAASADLIPVEEAPVVAERMAPEWHWAVDPLYSWLPGMKGSMRLNGYQVDLDITTGDILDHFDEFLHAIDGLYMGSGEYRNAQWGLQWDIVYLDLGATRSFGDEIEGAVDVGFKMSMTTLAGNYRVYQSPTAYADVLAGIRITDVQVDAAITLGQFGTSRSDGDTWVDPVVGVKGRMNLSQSLFLKGNALYGGFGVSSDHLYDVAGFLGYEFSNGMELYGGWRIADTDYENGDFAWDMQLSGPMMGLTLKF